MTGLGRGRYPGGSRVSAKAGKSDRGKSLKIGLFPLGTASHRTCWYLVPEWGSLLTPLSRGPVSVAPCHVVFLSLASGPGAKWQAEGLARCEPSGLNDPIIHALGAGLSSPLDL